MSLRSRRSIVVLLLLFAIAFSPGCGRSGFSPPPVAGRSTIDGVVVRDSDGAPVSAATVLLCRHTSESIVCYDEVGETTTDENGRYAFCDIPPGEYMTAVRISANAVFMMQKRSLGKATGESVTYSAESNQTVVALDIPLDREVQKQDESPVRLIYPTASTSIRDPCPTLKWEPVAGSEYFIDVARLDQPSEEKFIDRPMDPRESNIETVSKDLENGLYKWSVYAYPNGTSDVNDSPKKAVGYFTVAKAGSRDR